MICKAFAAKVWKHALADQIRQLEAKVGARALYVLGRGEESFDTCLASFRGQPGTLYIAADMRVFGSGRKAITEAVGKLESAGIRVVDLAHADLKTHAAQLEYGLARTAFEARWRGDPKAKHHGKAGGEAKRKAEAARRAAAAKDGQVRRVLELRAAGVITWDQASYILGEGFSVATLQRHYGKKK